MGLVLETEEESGSPNLLRLLDVAKDFIGAPDYMFCMDSGAFDYNQLWCTSSLLGGIILETFRIVRNLLDRIDNNETGMVVDDFQVEIPAWARAESVRMAELSGDEMHKKYDYCEGGRPMDCDNLPE